MDLTVVWAFIIAFAVFAYVVMDGFDLGIGILFPAFAACGKIMAFSFMPKSVFSETVIVSSSALIAITQSFCLMMVPIGGFTMAFLSHDDL